MDIVDSVDGPALWLRMVESTLIVSEVDPSPTSYASIEINTFESLTGHFSSL
jgi:hypothetical protein